jgi:hypothetical protein
MRNQWSVEDPSSTLEYLCSNSHVLLLRVASEVLF